MAVAPMRSKRRAPPHAFKKGQPRPEGSARKKGQRNRTTTMLKDAILEAASLVGQDGKGRDGLVGYLKMLAIKEKAVYARLLERVLPLQLHVEDKTDPVYTAAEAVQRLRERKLPVPPALLSLAANVPVIADNSQYDDELNGNTTGLLFEPEEALDADEDE
jgi:hypothetical protein